MVYGSLETGDGKFTLGIAEFANAGCTSSVNFNGLTKTQERKVRSCF